MAGPAPVAKPTPAPVSKFVGKPAEYWNDTTLSLSKGSIDDKYAKAKKADANVPHNYVSDLQRDLIELGYVKTGGDDGSFGSGTERAIQRFQRHAKRTFRMLNSTRIAVAAWGGNVTGICDAATAKEVRAWIDAKYRLPFGLNSMVDIKGGKMRNDVAKIWEQALTDVVKKGAILVPESAPLYGDTWRNPAQGFKSTGGNSKWSFHYTGRAVDLAQRLNDKPKAAAKAATATTPAAAAASATATTAAAATPAPTPTPAAAGATTATSPTTAAAAPATDLGQRYYVVKEDVGGDTFWRIYCKTEKQDGTQGTQIAKQTKKHYIFYKNSGETWMPEAWYLDLTQFLADIKFTRIKAHSDWQTNSKAVEWWHFHYEVDLQETFLDEVELIGVSEDKLKTAGWSTVDMDKKPG